MGLWRGWTRLVLGYEVRLAGIPVAHLALRVGAEQASVVRRGFTRDVLLRPLLSTRAEDHGLATVNADHVFGTNSTY